MIRVLIAGLGNMGRSHALAYLERMKGQFGPDQMVIVNLSGRGDKDMDELIRHRNQALGNEAGPPTRLFC